MHTVSTFNPQPPVLLEDKPVIAKTAVIRQVHFGRFTEVADFCSIAESSLDDYSYVMERSTIIYSIIGKFVNIASDVRINPGNHPMDWVSQHHFMYRRRRYGFAEKDDGTFFNWRRMQQVHIGHDVWIGQRSTIMPGISIGNGAVIGSGSVVTKNIDPYAVVAGNPARPLRYRFPERIRQVLEEIGWYHWDHETIKERLDDFRDIRLFLEKYGPSHLSVTNR